MHKCTFYLFIQTKETNNVFENGVQVKGISLKMGALSIVKEFIKGGFTFFYVQVSVMKFVIKITNEDFWRLTREEKVEIRSKKKIRMWIGHNLRNITKIHRKTSFVLQSTWMKKRKTNRLLENKNRKRTASKEPSKKPKDSRLNKI